MIDRVTSFAIGHWQLFGLLAVIFVLWPTPIVIPLKILVVFLHELSHGLAAMATGGAIEQINVSPQGGGFAITRGGSRFAILSAGYVGSLVIGASLLAFALRGRVDRIVMAVLGTVTLLVTALYLSDAFTLAFGSLAGAAMLACSKWLSVQINDMALRVIGLTSMIYVPYDIFDDTIRRSNLRSDARMLAEEVGGATVMWGVIWLLVSICVITATLRIALKEPSNLSFGSKPPLTPPKSRV